MFKGSKNVQPEAHTSMIASVGGQSNAYTTDDETVFWETVPAQYLPLALWLEADRMATLRVDKDTFTNEREVVKEERRMRIDNQPYGRLNEIIYDQAFTVHPYKHATIGSMADLEAASVDDVLDFYHTYYVPSNATLAIVGDFDSAQAVQLVTQYLGRVPKAERAVPRDIPQEPPQTKEKRVTLQEPWPLPAVVVAYHITKDGNPDSYPLHIVGKVLSDGQTSRIYKKLVYEKQIAVAAFGSANLIEDPNLFYAVAIVQPGHTTEEAIDGLIAEFDRLKTEPITEHELQRTKNQFARDYIIGRESDQQKAGPADPRRRHPQRHQDGGRRVRHLPEHHDRRRPAGREDLLPTREPPGADVDAVGKGRPAVTAAIEPGACRRLPRRVGAVALGSACASPAQPGPGRATGRPSGRRSRCAARDIKFPPYEIQTLPNGLQVVVVLHHEQPSVSMRLLVRVGTADDPRDKLGLAHLTASLLDQGTTTRSAQEMNDDVDFIGGVMGAGAGTDLTFVQMIVMKDSFEQGMRMLSDMARHPAFAPAEIERQRQQTMSGLKVSLEDPEYIANSVFDRLVYGFHPYGMPDTGTPEIDRQH